MAYKNNIPKAGDKINVSRADIEENFSQIDNIIKADHEEFGHAKQGRHKYSTYTVQTIEPTTDGNSVALFCKSNGTANSLHLKPLNNGTAIDIGSYTTSGSSGYFYLPSGILMQWGQGTFNAGAQGASVTFPKEFPSTCFTVTAVLNAVPGGDVRDGIFGTSTLTTTTANFIRSSTFKGTLASFRYLAIGV